MTTHTRENPYKAGDGALYMLTESCHVRWRARSGVWDSPAAVAVPLEGILAVTEHLRWKCEPWGDGGVKVTHMDLPGTHWNFSRESAVEWASGPEEKTAYHAARIALDWFDAQPKKPSLADLYDGTPVEVEDRVGNKWVGVKGAKTLHLIHRNGGVWKSDLTHPDIKSWRVLEAKREES